MWGQDPPHSSLAVSPKQVSSLLWASVSSNAALNWLEDSTSEHLVGVDTWEVLGSPRSKQSISWWSHTAYLRPVRSQSRSPGHWKALQATCWPTCSPPGTQCRRSHTQTRGPFHTWSFCLKGQTLTFKMKITVKSWSCRQKLNKMQIISQFKKTCVCLFF